MDEKQQQRAVNFTIVPDEETQVARVYSNFCAIQNSPFDFTLTFCEMLPLAERDIQQAQDTHVVKAPVRARCPSHLQYRGHGRRARSVSAGSLWADRTTLDTAGSSPGGRR